MRHQVTKGSYYSKIKPWEFGTHSVLYPNLSFEQGLVFIWLRIREFWESKAAIYLVIESQGRLSVMASSDSMGISGFIQSGRAEPATWKMSRVPCDRVSVSSFLLQEGVCFLSFASQSTEDKLFTLEIAYGSYKLSWALLQVIVCLSQEEPN